MKPAALACVLAMTSSAVSATESCIREISVGVVRADHRFPANLTPENFAAEIKGTPATVAYADLRTHPRRIVILLDTSASMYRTDTKWKMALAAISNLAKVAEAAHFGDRVEFQAFELEPEKTSAKGAAEISKKLEELSYRNIQRRKGAHETALLDSLMSAVKGLGPLAVGDVLYVITDSEDNSSRASASKVETTLIDQGVRLFALILQDYFRFAEFTPEDTVKDFRELALSTGGAAATIRSMSYRFTDMTVQNNMAAMYQVDELGIRELRELQETQYALMRFFWVVGISAPAADETLALKISINHSQKDVAESKISFPQRLRPCFAAPK